MAIENSDSETVTFRLTLPADLYARLKYIQSATNVPMTGVIQHFLDSTDLADTVVAIHERLADGDELPRMRKRVRYTLSSQQDTRAYLKLLTPRKRLGGLTTQEKALTSPCEPLRGSREGE